MTEDDDEIELSEFSKLVHTKVSDVMSKDYSDLDMMDGMGLRFDAQWAIEGREPYSRDVYSGPDWAEDFFNDHPKFKKILEDSEIKALRDDEIKQLNDEVEDCWGVTWDKNEIAYLMFTSVAHEADFNMTDEENFARQDAYTYCGVKHITDSKTIENRFDKKEEKIRNNTKPADMGIHSDYIGGEFKTTTRGANVYSSEHYARSIIKSGKTFDEDVMIKILSGCKHIADACTLKAVKRIKMKLIRNWLAEFEISESKLLNIPKLPSSSYGGATSSSGGNAKISSNKTSSSDSGCFIATAAYGTPFAEEINVLRNWRDKSLMITYSGKLFVEMYYTLSPPIANNIRTSSLKKKFVRLFLNPIVKVLSGSFNKEELNN